MTTHHRPGLAPLALTSTALFWIACKVVATADTTAASAGDESSSLATEPPSAPAAAPGVPATTNGGGEPAPGDVAITGSESPAPPGEAATEEAPPATPMLPGSTAECAPAEGPVPPLALRAVATGLNQPVFVTSAPGDASRLFVVEKPGTVRVISDGQLLDEPFIDVTPRVQSTLSQGLLGLAFHPDFASNGLFYLHFSAADGEGAGTGDSVIAEYRVDADNPNTASLETQRRVLSVDQPEDNHKGGMIAFGPDRQLWIAFGDGGGSNDPHGTIGNGQALDTPLGKLLRIDVDARTVGEAYGVSPGNMVGEGVNPAIWAYGLRDPWRFSFDACRGDVYIADVGQTAFEEINFLAASTPAGSNFGWRMLEGTTCRPGEVDCDAAGARLTPPIDGYSREVGRAVIGGYVYRGDAIPGLRGHYLYGDYGTGRVFRLRVEDGRAVDRAEITSELAPVGGDEDTLASFGQDNAGEVYVVTLAPGGVYRITAR